MTEALYHIETSPLICFANQWTGFYMREDSVMKGLIALEERRPLRYCNINGENNPLYDRGLRHERINCFRGTSSLRLLQCQWRKQPTIDNVYYLCAKQKV